MTASPLLMPGSLRLFTTPLLLAAVLLSAACGGNVAVEGSGGGGGTGTSTVTPGGPCAVEPDEEPCPAGLYCLAADCHSGTCELPDSATELSAVCGCDGLTYWNAAVAAAHGTRVALAGECVETSKFCGGFDGMSCPPESNACSFFLELPEFCGAFDLGGKCWVLPEQCPSSGFPLGVRCADSGCVPRCELIASGDVWYDDLSCSE